MIIFGLGNPGSTYRLTRHNIGFHVAERFAHHYKKRFRTKQGYQIAVVGFSHTTVHLVKPQCWMNRSGSVVRRYMEKAQDDFMVISDDVNLPPGRMRLRLRGSDGGHNGLRSVIEEMSSQDFPRLRIGIGRQGEDLAEYVLGAFKRREKRILDATIDKAVEGLTIYFTAGFQKAQNFINSVNLSENE
ncbi:aminoacyl-tRNA hydrolase [candidate division WOR-3 bacterium]|nr:aminoacyl-tRNA hydrolase [candidate division WOR-3 bacterium]